MTDNENNNVGVKLSNNDITSIHKIAEQYPYVLSQIGLNLELGRNGNGLLGKTDQLHKKLNKLQALFIKRFNRIEAEQRVISDRFFAEIDGIKRTNISYLTFVRIGNIVIRVSAVIGAVLAICKLFGWF